MTDRTERLCPSCGHANPVDAQFCRECGAILVQGRDATRRAVEPPSPQPSESPRVIEPVRVSSRTGLLAGGAALLLLLFVALVVYPRLHKNELIPSPGDTTPTAIPPREAPSQQAAAQPTASGELQRRAATGPAEPQAPAPREAPEPRAAEHPRAAPPAAEEARARAVPTEEPPTAQPTGPPHVEARAIVPRREEHGEEARLRRQPGWYRVRYRSPLFQAPSETAPIVTQIPAGTRIHVTHVLPGFLAVESTTGKAPGFLSSDDALPDSVAGPVR